MNKFTITFYPDNKKIEVTEETTVLAAAISAGVYVNSTCGGDGVCGRCKVFIRKGTVTTQPTGRLTIEERKQGMYLACLTVVHSDAEIEIPSESRLDFEHLPEQDRALRLQGLFAPAEDVEIEANDRVSSIFSFIPVTSKFYLELSPPTLEDSVSDLDRLYREIKKVKKETVSLETSLSNIRKLGELLRLAEWKVTVTLFRRGGVTEVVLIEPGDTSHKNYGFAFDIGTTTISGRLVNLQNKHVIGTKAVYNKQATFGSDVISRIVYAHQEDGLEKLHHAVIDSMNEIIRDLTSEHAVDLNDVTCVACSGNTTMLHLLLRIDPAYIRREPYIPTVNSFPVMRALEGGIKINPRGVLVCIPGVASYVGGDVTAGVLSSGLYREEALSVLIDIGTNGEVVVGNKEFMISSAASAGPAFEGSGVASGMRSSRGAIQRVEISPEWEVRYETIGAGRPRGICGSGYIDTLSQLFIRGIIDRSGKIIDREHRRIRTGEMGREFIVAFREESETGNDIIITEADIENLKRAKAAIYSSVHILLKHLNLDFTDVHKFFIAGGFGTYLDIDHAVTIGLLPDMDKSKFVFLGNSSLAGSCLVLLSREALIKSDEIAGKITYFELSADSGYMDEYMSALFFPHTDLSRFPNVK